jgi:hypothetical protein
MSDLIGALKEISEDKHTNWMEDQPQLASEGAKTRYSKKSEKKSENSLLASEF